MSVFKYREGACENCGAMGHKKKQCMERPRAIGAKYSNTNIAPDDSIVPTTKDGYDIKRDRWNGYDTRAYNKQVAEEYEKMEEARRLLRGHDDEAIDEDREIEEEKYADDMAPGQSVDMDSRTRITVRNLRIREDTAKYLYNLDEQGAYYDPKSRAMRESPFLNLTGKEELAAKFAGDNFIRYTGEVVQANEAQVFAWHANKEGVDVNALAEPTRLEALKKEYEREKSAAKETLKRELLEKYGPLNK